MKFVLQFGVQGCLMLYQNSCYSDVCKSIILLVVFCCTLNHLRNGKYVVIYLHVFVSHFIIIAHKQVMCSHIKDYEEFYYKRS